MGFHIRDLSYYQNLGTTAAHVLELLSKSIDVNTFFLSHADDSDIVMVEVFNRHAAIISKGAQVPFKDTL